MQADPQFGNQAPPLPTVADGDIDWDAVSEDYHGCILGPFAPEMVTPDRSGTIRNKLVADLAAARLGLQEGTRAADFGCGPGNLIPYVPSEIVGLTGVDKSERALSLAAEAADRRNVPFDACLADLCCLDLQVAFDAIFCVNAILPDSREQVVRILDSVKRHLRPTGRLAAILPAYDTTVYLRNLWHEYHVDRLGPAEAERIMQAYTEAKKMDDATSSYADDGRTSQCYHTPTTIEAEFGQVGLQIERQERIYYPWELVQRFDYGYFPEAPEEIWDWYVVASLARR